MEQHFFMHGNMPHLTLVLSLADAGGGGGARPPLRDRNGNAAAELESKLTEATRPVYLALKDWRNRTSKMKGVPAYAIARNRQLVEIVLKAPKTLAELKEIEGCGESFCKSFGAELLALLKDVEPTETESCADDGRGDLPDSDGRGDLTNRPPRPDSCPQRPLYQSGPTKRGPTGDGPTDARPI